MHKTHLLANVLAREIGIVIIHTKWTQRGDYVTINNTLVH